jgi:hypothetical protein
MDDDEPRTGTPFIPKPSRCLRPFLPIGGHAGFFHLFATGEQPWAVAGFGTNPAQLANRQLCPAFRRSFSIRRRVAHYRVLLTLCQGVTSYGVRRSNHGSNNMSDLTPLVSKVITSALLTSTILTLPEDRGRDASAGTDKVYCEGCDNVVDSPDTIASYPSGECPQCGTAWTGKEKRSTLIQVTMPESIMGGAG